MKKAQFKTIEIDVVDNKVIELDQFRQGYIVSVIEQANVVKKWKIDSPVIDTEKVAKCWYNYVVNSIRQNVSLGLTGIPAMIRNSSSSDVQGMVTGVLNHL